MVDPLLNAGSFLFYPPIASSDSVGPGFLETFYYDAPFADFGPRTAEFPEFEMSFVINQLMPTRIGYEQCNMAGECAFSNSPLASIGGSAVTVSHSYGYLEGRIEGGTLTFYTPACARSPARRRVSVDRGA
ncbi:hypothetical protein EOK75_20340 (plasmid) [Pseudorhodobacter turbinis]|uniref:Uncharacterized protein n=1 Tax=Pseudorhodobacter turbinis TaxID=2500533 RepID=A0A4P8ELF2_9RHOB|nr:hypothetical protein [Pseudorhodobacter turbinis]QCO58111.1 hypothetical protein EOK75_20340 [Pseudorhodobacter turbinis]